MASNRHLGRIVALQTLYEQDFRRESGDTSFDLGGVLKRNITRYESTVDDVFFIEKLVLGVASHEAELDEKLMPLAPEWPIKDIARMDRIVLRIGLYELLYHTDVPPKVVINEAVELAKAFGGDNSSKFINGVLGTALKNLTPASETASVEASAVVTADKPAEKLKTVKSTPASKKEGK
jgi:N utilization substance protein B